MKFSVIIPTHNSEKTIDMCLSAIYNAKSHERQVIVVDDCSNDNTIEHVTKFPCHLIRLAQRSGPSRARYEGQLSAVNDLLVFIDSDIVIEPDTFLKLEKIFDSPSAPTAVIGILSAHTPLKGFFSQYKNLYMNYILQQCPESVDFIYGSFYAIRKEFIPDSWTSQRFAEDTRLGALIHSSGGTILLKKEIEVRHFKEYNLWSFIQNDFRIPYFWARLFVSQRGMERIIKTRRFFHASSIQLISIIIANSGTLLCLIYPYFSLLCFLLFVALNRHFFLFLGQQQGIIFMMRSILVAWVDALIMAVGIVTGFCSVPISPTHNSTYKQL